MASISEDDSGSSSGLWGIARRTSRRISKKKSRSSPDVRKNSSPRKTLLPSELKASAVLSILQQKLAFLSGGLDKNGRCIITVQANKDHKNNNQNATSYYEELSTTLQYLDRIPSQEHREKGFTVILDLRGSVWKETKNLIKVIVDSLFNVRLLLVIKPDDFWEKRRSSFGYKIQKSGNGYDTILLSTLSKIYQYVEQSELTSELDGYLQYDHDAWIKLRFNLEKFIEKHAITMRQLNEISFILEEKTIPENAELCRDFLTEHDLLQSRIFEIIENIFPLGESVLQELHLPGEPLPGDPVAAYSMDSSLIDVEIAMDGLRVKEKSIMEAWQMKKRLLMQCLRFHEYEEGYYKVLDWVTEAGFEKLSENWDIGDSLNSAEALRKEHEQFENMTKPYIDMFGQLREQCRSMIREDHYATKELKHRKKYLDMICKSFADYMEKKRKMLFLSVKFHKHAAEFARRQDDLLDFLCTESDALAENVAKAESVLDSLRERMEGVNNSADQTYREGNKIIAMAKEPIFSATGTNISPDFRKAIDHCNTVLDELEERKQRSDELSDVRKLKLQQCLQLRTCERDAEQALIWLKELCEVMINTQKDLGRNEEETKHLIEEHRKFEKTAKGTFDYGKQLLSAALVLRRSGRYDVTDNEEMMEDLINIWDKFDAGIQERGDRLALAEKFHNVTNKVLQHLDDISHGYLSGYSSEEIDCILEDPREFLYEGFAEALALGKVLIDQLQYPLIPEYHELEDDNVFEVGDELEVILDELRLKRQHVDEIVEDFQERYNYDRRRHFDNVDGSDRKHIVDEVVLSEEINMLENATPYQEDANLTKIEDQVEEAMVSLNESVNESVQDNFSFGETLTEAYSCNSQHETVERKLKETEDLISELCRYRKLCKQDSEFNGNQKSEDLKAIQDTLKKASRKIAKRRDLIDSSVEFHEKATKFETLMDNAMDNITKDKELPMDLTDAKNSLGEHHELRKNILELSMETLSKGQLLLEKLREATKRAGINSRHATKSACYGIERTLEALQGRRRKLEEVWKQRKKLLEQCVRSCKLDEEIKKVTDWLRTDGDEYLESHVTYGDSAAETDALTEEHNKFEREFKEKSEIVQKLQRDGQKLIHAGHFDAATIKYKVNKLDEMFKGFSFQLEQRRRVLNQTHGFYRSSQPGIDTCLLTSFRRSKKLQYKRFPGTIRVVLINSKDYSKLLLPVNHYAMAYTIKLKPRVSNISFLQLSI